MILASSSPQRKRLFRHITNEALFMSIETDESFSCDLDVYENIKIVATNKALAVKEKYDIKNDIIIGADTIVVLNGNILLKPKDYNDAYNMIKSYNNNKAEIISGVAIVIVENGECSVKTFTESSYISFSNITDEKINQWLEQDDFLGCSGAIKIEKVGEIFDTKVDGSISNIIGLPIERLSREVFYIDDERFKPLAQYKDYENNIKVRSSARILPIKDGKVFFIKQKNYDGDIGYTLIGGGCTIEEDILEGAKRELLEETGFIVDEVLPIGKSVIYQKWLNSEEGLNDRVNYHYITYGFIKDIQDSNMLEYEKEMIEGIVGFEINDAIKLFNEQNFNWKGAKNDFYYSFNIGTVEALEILKKTLEY